MDLCGWRSIHCFTSGGGREHRAALGWSGAQAVYRLTHVEHRELVDLYLRTGPLLETCTRIIYPLYPLVMSNIAIENGKTIGKPWEKP